MRFTFVAAAYRPSTPHASGVARLASGAFYAAIALATFYEIIRIQESEFRMARVTHAAWGHAAYTISIVGRVTDPAHSRAPKSRRQAIGFSSGECPRQTVGRKHKRVGLLHTTQSSNLVAGVLILTPEFLLLAT